ncbi:hypothetical protein HID58_044316 [Brassica napus]|uniref:(rape) hypothetical protein n=1 Tax=Brassica napus TaxID=3708 RepID=A0A078JWM4_BRANA|nr:hypothetical protein HID58_044316 [Brassica napus]CAF2079549.1 unnamed protein product [Brassica napus]CDY71159.1 BnaCnng71620D [Brassica napus]
MVEKKVEVVGLEKEVEMVGVVEVVGHYTYTLENDNKKKILSLATRRSSMAPTIRTVATYNTHQEHTVDFFGNEFTVTVTRSTSVITRWINNVQYYNHYSSSHPLVVGVGVQWTPADPEADTLQLCVGTRCLVIQLSHCDDVPDELRSFLTDPRTVYVGFWNGQDAGKLARSRHGLEIGELLDLRNYVQDSGGFGMSRCSFEEMVEECMGYQGVRLDRGISMSDWSAYELDHEQILQASVDAYVCFELGVWVRLWEY